MQGVDPPCFYLPLPLSHVDACHGISSKIKQPKREIQGNIIKKQKCTDGAPGRTGCAVFLLESYLINLLCDILTESS